MAAEPYFSLKDLDPEAYTLAEKAARAAGISVEEWVKRAILRRTSAHAQAAPRRQRAAGLQPVFLRGANEGAAKAAPMAAVSSPLTESAGAAARTALDEIHINPAASPQDQGNLLTTSAAIARGARNDSTIAPQLANSAQSPPNRPSDLAEIKRVLETIGASSTGSPVPAAQGPIPQPAVPISAQTRTSATAPTAAIRAIPVSITKVIGVNFSARNLAQPSARVFAPNDNTAPPTRQAPVDTYSATAPGYGAKERAPPGISAKSTQPDEEPLELNEPIADAEAESKEAETVASPQARPAARPKIQAQMRPKRRGGNAFVLLCLFLLVAAGAVAGFYFWSNPAFDIGARFHESVAQSVRSVERIADTLRRKTIMAIKSVQTARAPGSNGAMEAPATEREQNIGDKLSATKPSTVSHDGGVGAAPAPSSAGDSASSRQAPKPAVGGIKAQVSEDGGEASSAPSAGVLSPTPATPESARPQSAAAPGNTSDNPSQVSASPPAAAPPAPITAPPFVNPIKPGEEAGNTATLAVSEIEALAKKGDARAQHDLAALYARGDRLPQDYGKAAYWFREAALQGVPAAEYNLGVLYDQGLGVEKNPLEALLWYLSAAEQGHVAAQYNVGTSYSDGKGVPKNYAEARRWLTMAAEQGLAKASYSLGVLNELGLGASSDLVEAYKWYKLASRGGVTDADKRLDDLGKKMTPEQVGEANKRYAAAAVEIPPAPSGPTGRATASPLQRPETPPAKRPTTSSGVAPTNKPAPTARAKSAATDEAASAKAGSMTSTNAGEASPTVLEIQRLLGQLGYNPGPASGHVDLQTAAAIREFQKEAGLPVDGQATSKLLQFIKQLSGKS